MLFLRVHGCSSNAEFSKKEKTKGNDFSTNTNGGVIQILKSKLDLCPTSQSPRGARDSPSDSHPTAGALGMTKKTVSEAGGV